MRGQVTASKEFYTPPELAERLGVSVEKVIEWVRNCEIRAANLARRGCSRPRWRIAAGDVDRFLEARQNQPPPPKQERRRQDPNIIKYY